MCAWFVSLVLTTLFPPAAEPPAVRFTKAADPAGRPEIKWVYTTTGEKEEEYVNIRSSTPKRIVEAFAGELPIVGLEHLPRSTRYDARIDAPSWPDSSEFPKYLAGLGESLGLTIGIKTVETRVLLVRNHTAGLPPTWQPTTVPRGYQDAEPEVKEIDPVDHLYRALAVDIGVFFSFLRDHTTTPLLDQTALSFGKYDFSFVFDGSDVPKLLRGMGFDVVEAKRTLRCVVIEPRTGAGPAGVSQRERLP